MKLCLVLYDITARANEVKRHFVNISVNPVTIISMAKYLTYTLLFKSQSSAIDKHILSPKRKKLNGWEKHSRVGQ